MTKDKLQTALSDRLKTTAELEELHRFDADTGEQLAKAVAVATVADLKDDARLAKIARLQTVKSLTPQAIASRELASEDGENTLQRTCETFISETLGPKIRKQLQRAKDKARKELAPHFTDTDALNQAIEASSLVREFDSLTFRATIKTGHGGLGVTGYARGLIETFETSETLEAKLS